MSLGSCRDANLIILSVWFHTLPSGSAFDSLSESLEVAALFWGEGVQDSQGGGLLNGLATAVPVSRGLLSSFGRGLYDGLETAKWSPSSQSRKTLHS